MPVCDRLWVTCVNTVIVNTYETSRVKSADGALFIVVFDQLKRTMRLPVTDMQELQRGARKAACNFIPIMGHFYQKKKAGGLCFWFG